LSAASTLLSPGSEFQAGGNPPLAGAPPVKAKAKAKKSKVKSKPKPQRKAKRARKVGLRAGSRGGGARRVATGGRAERKAGR
jgi:hypothetical protein